MEGAGAFPVGGVSAPELADLVAKSEEPFVSLYLGTEPGVENAAQRSELKWKDARRDLESAGASETVLGSIEPLIPDAHTRGNAIAIIADTSGGFHVEH